MTQYSNENKGVLFVNDRKASDRHPDMNGKLNINGVEHWFSGWWKQGARGEFLSISLGAPVEQRHEQPQRQQAPSGRGRPQPQQAAQETFDDQDCPF